MEILIKIIAVFICSCAGKQPNPASVLKGGN